MKKDELIPMSASRIKSAKECSWKYYCKYILRLPETTNNGALMGGIVHEVLETAFKQEDRDIFNFVSSGKSTAVHEYVNETITVEAQKAGLTEQEHLDMMFKMTDNALTYDFFGEKEEKPHMGFAEMDFDYIEESEFGPFRILGFIDQIFLYGKGRVLIRDFKTSKKVFSGIDAEDNLQDSIYSYASKTIFPEVQKTNTEFLFLKFDLQGGGCLRMPEISKYEHKGFEAELAGWQNIVQNYDEAQAHSKFAAKQPYPTDDSFTGPLMCGFAKYPGQLKKDGTLMFHCPFKFPFDFYAIVDEDGKKVKTAFPADLEKLKETAKGMNKEGIKIKKFSYDGCPAHKKSIDNW